MVFNYCDEREAEVLAIGHMCMPLREVCRVGVHALLCFGRIMPLRPLASLHRCVLGCGNAAAASVRALFRGLDCLLLPDAAALLLTADTFSIVLLLFVSLLNHGDRASVIFRCTLGGNYFR